MRVLLGLLRFGCGLMSIGLGAAAIAAWFGFAVPLFDLFNHVQLLLIGGLVVALLAVLVFFGGSAWQLPLAAFVLLGVLASAATVVPETLLALAPRPPLPTDGRPVLKLMTHNIFGLNYDMARVARVIAAENPDIIALQEDFPDQRADLSKRLAATYPHSAYCVGGRRANIAVYSKLPFTQIDDGGCTQDPDKAGRTAHIIVRFTLGDGTTFSVLTTHFDWPAPLDRRRNEDDIIVKALATVDGPVIVAGDFNAAPWSYEQRGFADAAGLTRQTHGQLSWPTEITLHGLTRTAPFLPLDQVMTRGAITVHDLQLGPQTGSDHLPLVATFSVGR